MYRTRPSTAGRATEGSTVRQRIMRLKPLYLQRRHSMAGWSGVEIQAEPEELFIRIWWPREFARSAMGNLSIPSS